MGLSTYRLGQSYPRTRTRMPYPIKRKKKLPNYPKNLNKTVSNTINFVGIATGNFFYNKSATNTITFSQLATANHVYPLFASNNFVITSQVLLGQITSKSVSNSLALVNIAEALRITRAKNTFVISQSVSALSLSKHPQNTLNLVQTLSVEYHANTSAYNPMAIVQSVSRQFIGNRQLTSNLNFVGVATEFIVRMKSASNFLGLFHFATGVRIIRPFNTIVFTGTAGFIRVRNRGTKNTINFQHFASQNTIRFLNASNVLEFQQGFTRLTQVGDIFVPPAQVTKVTKIVTLNVPGFTVVLPRPLLGDTEAYTGIVKIKKAIQGKIYTYVNRSQTKILKYAFQIGRQKSLELLKFYKENNGNLITLSNWKGEIWKGYLTMNPIDFTAQGRSVPCNGEVFNVSLEFEGVRVI